MPMLPRAVSALGSAGDVVDTFGSNSVDIQDNAEKDYASATLSSSEDAEVDLADLEGKKDVCAPPGFVKHCALLTNAI
jgi:hypothetical protein